MSNSIDPNLMSPKSRAGTREKTRTSLAIGCLFIYGVTVFIGLIYFVLGNATPVGTNGILAIASSVVGVLGFALGFYFGQKEE